MLKRKRNIIDYENVKEINLSYIAGFLEGDGCILSQIIKRKDYKFGFELRLSVSFYQKVNRY